MMVPLESNNQDDIIAAVVATHVVAVNERRPDPPSDHDDALGGFDPDPEADSMVPSVNRNDPMIERNRSTDSSDTGKEQKESTESNMTLSNQQTYYNHKTNNDSNDDVADAATNSNDSSPSNTDDAAPANTNDTTDQEDEDTDEFIELVEDTYSLFLVTTSWRRPSFWYPLFIWLQQVGLLYAILTQQFDTGRVKRTVWNVPFSNSTPVQFGQFTAIIFSLFTQRDLLQTIPICIAFLQRKQTNWNNLISLKRKTMSNNEESGDSQVSTQEEEQGRLVISTREQQQDIQHPTQEQQGNHKKLWWKSIFLTYLLKIGVSSLTLFTTFVVIVQSTDIIELVKDFTALYIIAELDSFAYMVVIDGYFGSVFQQEVKRVNEFRVKKGSSQVEFCNMKIQIQSLIVLFLFFTMMGTWARFVSLQNSGAIFHQIYKDCDAFEKNYRSLPTLSYTNFGDGTCDPRLFTEECGFDGGDCNDECSTFFQFTVMPRVDDYVFDDLFKGIILKENETWRQCFHNYYYYDDDDGNDDDGNDDDGNDDDGNDDDGNDDDGNDDDGNDDECSDLEQDKFNSCIDALYKNGDLPKYENWSKCLSDETLYNSESDNYLYCWFGSEAVIDPKKIKKLKIQKVEQEQFFHT